MPKTYNAIQAANAQAKYCEDHELPMFAPANGWCGHCGRNIFEPYTYRREPIVTMGITVEEAGSRHITGCPLCGHTFCD